MSNRPVSIILGNATINNGNRGCVALSVSMIAIIDEIFREAGVPYTLYLPDSHLTDRTPHTYQYNGKEAVYHELNYPIGISVKSWLNALFNTLTGRSQWNVFRKADYVLDIGQGDSFADIYGERRFRSIDRIHRLARLCGKPYCLLPQTIGPFKDSSIRAKAVKSIQKAEWCMCRDKQSLDYVKEIAPKQPKCKEYIDVAFFLPYDTITQHDSSKIHIGLNISALLWHGGYTRNNQFGLTVDYHKLCYDIIDYFLQKDNVVVHLVAHVVDSQRGVENDYGISYDLWKQYHNPRVVLAPLALGPSEIKSYIAGLDFFMGARMHATIAAYSSGVPLVPMAYSRKFNGLFQDTLDYHAFVDMKATSNEEALHTIAQAFEARATHKADIKEKMAGIVQARGAALKQDLKTFFHLT